MTCELQLRRGRVNGKTYRYPPDTLRRYAGDSPGSLLSNLGTPTTKLWPVELDTV